MQQVKTKTAKNTLQKLNNVYMQDNCAGEPKKNLKLLPNILAYMTLSYSCEHDYRKHRRISRTRR